MFHEFLISRCIQRSRLCGVGGVGMGGWSMGSIGGELGVKLGCLTLWEGGAARTGLLRECEGDR
jgi:hypothetical protein